MSHLLAGLIGAMIGIAVVALVAKSATYLPVVACLLPNRYVGWRYFLVPVITVGLSWLLLSHMPAGHATISDRVSITSVLRFLAGLVFLSSLVGLAIESFTRGSVPTLLCGSGIVCGCLLALFVPSLAGEFGIPYLPPALDSFVYNLLGCVLGLGVFWAGHRVNREVGSGLAPLAGMMGAFLGPPKLLVALYLFLLAGGVVAIINVGTKAVWTTVSKEMEMEGSINGGGILALAGICVFFFGDSLVEVCVTLLGGPKAAVGNAFLLLASGVFLSWQILRRLRKGANREVKAVVVLGIAGGVLDALLALYMMVFGGLTAAGVLIVGCVILWVAVLGIAGGAVARKKPTLGGILMLVAGGLNFFDGWPGVIAGFLFINGGILALSLALVAANGQGLAVE